MAVAGLPIIASALGSMGLSSGAAAAGSSILTSAAAGALMNKMRGGSAFEGAAAGGMGSALGVSPGWGGLIGGGATPGAPPATSPASGQQPASSLEIPSGGGLNQLPPTVEVPQFENQLPPMPDPLELNQFLQTVGLR